MSKVDICICVKDRQSVIKKTVGDLFKQTFQDYKILICDGLSMDNTMNNIMNIQDANPGKVIAWQTEQEGYVNTHNFILSKTDAEYICFIGSDDFVDENKLEEQVKYLDEHPEVDVVSTSVMFPNKKVLVNSYVPLNNEQIEDALKRNIPMNTICHFESCMFRRRCLEKFKKGKYFFDEYETGRCGEGFLYTLYFLDYNFANITSTVYLYTKGVAKNSMSKNIVPEFANLIDVQEYDMKETAIMEMFNNYNK